MDVNDIKKGINPSGMDPVVEEKAIKSAKYSWQDVCVVLKAMHGAEDMDTLEAKMAKTEFTLNDAEDALIAHKYSIFEKSDEKKAKGRRL